MGYIYNHRRDQLNHHFPLHSTSSLSQLFAEGLISISPSPVHELDLGQALISIVIPCLVFIASHQQFESDVCRRRSYKSNYSLEICWGCSKAREAPSADRVEQTTHQGGSSPYNCSLRCTDKLGPITQVEKYLRDTLMLKPADALYFFCGSGFSPTPDQIIGDLFEVRHEHLQ